MARANRASSTPNVFWPNMAELIAAAPLVFAMNPIAALASLAQMIRSRSWSDPVSLTLLAAFLAFTLQLIATSKHFALHYMMASWVLVGGILVLAALQVRRLVPALSPAAIATVVAAICVTLVGQTLYEIRRQAIEWMALDDVGARLSVAVAQAGPACASVSGPFVRAPEDEMNHGWHMTIAGWGTLEQKERFSDFIRPRFQRALARPRRSHERHDEGFSSLHLQATRRRIPLHRRPDRRPTRSRKLARPVPVQSRSMRDRRNPRDDRGNSLLDHFRCFRRHAVCRIGLMARASSAWRFLTAWRASGHTGL